MSYTKRRQIIQTGGSRGIHPSPRRFESREHGHVGGQIAWPPSLAAVRRIALPIQGRAEMDLELIDEDGVARRDRSAGTPVWGSCGDPRLGIQKARRGPFH